MNTPRALTLTVSLATALAGVAIAAPATAAPEVMGGIVSHGHNHGKIVTHSRGHKGYAGATGAAGNLKYQGMVHGIGVTIGKPKVYLVFWGSQWGTQTIDSVTGISSFSNDAKGVAPVLQKMFAGLGTNGELWSGVNTQYCESSATVTVAVGATSCPSAAPHVGYPTGGALAGVVYDNSLQPTQATDNQIATVAVKAATTVGNTTAAQNRSAQYVVVSPSGLHPGGFATTGANWCAWHDWNGDTTLVGGAATSTVGDIAFTNLPYIPDMLSSCGMNYVNAGAAGTLDGVTMVAGHEYAETITDQNPAGGWYDTTGGGENADKCSWIGTGGLGGSQNVTFATGTFAMQGTWSNDTADCRIAHAIVTGTTNVVTFPASTSAQTSTVGTAITPVQMTASDSNATETLTYAATGLPAGLAISASSGLISGTPTSAILNSAVTVTASDSAGASATSSFTWTVNNVAGNTVTVTPVANKTSTRGTAASQQMVATDNQAGQKLTWSATGLPTGLTINASTGLISGTPSAGGVFTPRITATDTTAAFGSTSFTWTITVPNTITITKPANQSTPRSTTITPLQIVAVDSGAQAMTYSASNLPTGLTISSTTGLISGKTNTTRTTKTVTVTVKEKNNTAITSSTTFTWAVT